MFDLRQLQLFTAVAEFGSLSRAAVALSVSQPVISRQIKALEEELGVELLYRNGRGIVLTEAGKLLENYASAILEQASRATTEIAALRSNPRGTIVIGMPPSVGNWLTAVTGRADWHCFLAFDGERPVGAGALYVCDRIGWIGIGATLESHRGRKAQQAILAARIAKGVERGCEHFTTETGIPHEGEAGPSFKNIQRAGLKVAYERPNFTRG